MAYMMFYMSPFHVVHGGYANSYAHATKMVALGHENHNTGTQQACEQTLLYLHVAVLGYGR